MIEPVSRSRRTRRGLVVAVVLVLLLLTVPTYVINSGALRTFAERQMNKHLQGYSPVRTPTSSRSS